MPRHFKIMNPTYKYLDNWIFRGTSYLHGLNIYIIGFDITTWATSIYVCIYLWRTSFQSKFLACKSYIGFDMLTLMHPLRPYKPPPLSPQKKKKKKTNVDHWTHVKTWILHIDKPWIHFENGVFEHATPTWHVR